MRRAFPNHATVLHRLIAGQKPPEALSTLDRTCTAGGRCSAVQKSPTARQALNILQTAVAAGHGSWDQWFSLTEALVMAGKALRRDLRAIKLAVHGYEAAIGILAQGDAAVIADAGLLSRIVDSPSLPLGKVAWVHSKPGKREAEAVVTWPAGPGATSYAVEVNFTPGDPSAPYVALPPGVGRQRLVKAPAPASQFLARVASVASDGTRSAWSDPTLGTTR